MGDGGRATTATRSVPVSPAGSPPSQRAAAPRRAGLAALITVGTLAAGAVAVGGTALGTARRGALAAWIPRSWLVAHPLVAPRVATASAAVLVLAWLAVVALTARGRLGARAVCGISALWAAPLAVGAPLLSADAYAYLADGRLLISGLDPYRTGPSALGPGNGWLGAVDPQWAHARAPYGPAALLLARAAAATGSVGAGIAVLVVVSLVAVAVTGWAIWSLAPQPWRATALAVWLPSPLVLLHLVGGAHLDAAMVAMTVGALVALRRRPVLAAALAGAATAVKAPAVVAVLVVAIAVTPRWTWAAVRAAAGRLAVSAAVYAALAFVVTDPWRLASTLSGPARAQTYAAPTTWITEAFGGHGRDGVRVAALVVAAIVATWLLLTSERRPPAATVGWALLAVVVASPVFYPWYLTWPLACLAPVLRRNGARWLVPLIALAALPALPGLAGLSPLGVGIVVVAVAVVGAAAVAAGRDVARQHA